MPATFSVPARAPRSWPPPLICGIERQAIAADQRTDALRAADLVRRQRHQIGAERLEITGDAARPLHRVDMQEAAGRMHDRRRLRDRLDHAGLVVGEHQRDQRPRAAGQACAPALRDRRRRRPSPGFPRPRQIVRRSRTDGCSIAETSSVSPSAGDSASMLASVPPEVNTTSRALAPTSAATCSRAVSTRRRAARPAAWTDDGLPVTIQRRRRPRPAPPAAAAPSRSSRDRPASACALHPGDLRLSSKPLTPLILLAFGTRGHVRTRRPSADRRASPELRSSSRFRNSSNQLRAPVRCRQARRPRRDRCRTRDRGLKAHA